MVFETIEELVLEVGKKKVKRKTSEEIVDEMSKHLRNDIHDI
ncbi:MAG: hypothetical protein OEY31_06775 [Candidatus Bathyarchaeota archaeon]|nr:hypothetical protein [Candidatus Bathyarchaeota archaeon]